MAINWGQVAGIVGSLASNYAGARNAARQQQQVQATTQNSQEIAQRQNQNQLMLQMAQLEMLRKQMEESNRQNRAYQTGRGDLLANVQDVRIDTPGHIPRVNISGGLRPSALGPNARAAGATLSNEALAALMEGDSFMPTPMQGMVDLDANMPREGWFDKLMGAVGAAGNVYGAYQAANQPTQGASQPTGRPPSWYDNFIRMTGSGMPMGGAR